MHNIYHRKVQSILIPASFLYLGLGVRKMAMNYHDACDSLNFMCGLINKGKVDLDEFDWIALKELGFKIEDKP